MLDPDLLRIIFALVNFLVLTVLLYHVLFRPVMRTVRERAAEKERLEQELAHERQVAERLRIELEEKLADAEQIADKILTEAREHADTERKLVLEEARQEVERILTEARADARRMQQQAAQEYHTQILDAILAVSGQVIRRVTPPEVHRHLAAQVTERIWELGRSEIERVEALRRSLDERTPTAYVVSARELPPEQQGELARTLTALADRHVDLTLNIDPSLIVGLRIRLEDMIIDNSIADRLREMREDVAEALGGRLKRDE